MNRYLYVFLLVMLFFLSATSQNFEGGFNFKLPYDDSTTVEFLPHFTKNPITEADFITTGNSGEFYCNGNPIRFFGGNCTTQGAFPLKEDAPKIAGRMRKMGINLIRFHHIDNPWSNGSLFYGITGTRNFNKDLLDRLDYFIYQLKQNGIYVNMNLNVSRTFEKSDGILAADSLSDYGKGLTIFNRRMIELEKEYAQKLLGHANPYTGIPLAEDPVLGMVEIVNENSLYRRWYSDDLKPISNGGSMPTVYALELDRLWNDFLRIKYDSTAKLADVWNSLQILGDTIFTEDFEGGLNTQIWQMEQHEGAEAIFNLNTDGENNEVLVETIKNGAQAWHITFKNVGLSVKKDSVYELYFRAKSDAEYTMSAGFQRNNSPWTYYDGVDFPVGTEYREYKVIFKAPEDNNGNLRICFRFDFNLGKFYIDDVIFKGISTAGLEEGESLEHGTVGRVPISKINGYTKQRIYDMAEFYAQVQIDFLNEMKSFLKDSLRVKSPITGTNWFIGPEDVFMENSMDYIDNHSYWDHPQFPNQAWSATDWKINNTPMLTGASSTIENLFVGLSVKNKPYTVSEYNHGYPNQYQSEMLPIITSYLSYNGADGIMFFTYSSSWEWENDVLNGYFDLHRNNAVLSGFPIFSYVYRNRLIDEATTSLVLNYRKKDLWEMPFIIENFWSTHVPYSKKLGYNNRIVITFNEDETHNTNDLPVPTDGPYSLNNGQIYWNKNGLFKINTNKFVSIAGHLNQNTGAETEMMKLESANDFGSVSWLTLVDSALNVSSKSVIHIGTKQKNSGMIWDGVNTVHNNWGHSPSYIAPLQVSLKLKNESAGLKVTPMNATGEPVQEKVHYFVTDETGYSKVNLNIGEDKTIWYAVETISDWSSTVVHENKFNRNSIICYPNPSSDVIYFRNKNSDSKMFDLQIFDLTGKLIFSGQSKNTYSLKKSDLNDGMFIYRAVQQMKVSTGIFILK